MIIIYNNTQEDTGTFRDLYKDLPSATIMENPKRADVEDILYRCPDEDVLLFGHGSERGLFSAWIQNNEHYLIDKDNAHLLRNRKKLICIWCWATEFGAVNKLDGFFTSMFISNPEEGAWFLANPIKDKEVYYKENEKFAKNVNQLIKDNVPLIEYPWRLWDARTKNSELSAYNYRGMSYFQGDHELTNDEEVDE